MKIKLKQLDPRAVIPSKGTAGAACWDLYALEDTYFLPNETKLIKTGWSVEPPFGYRINIYIRSSAPLKKKLQLANGVGIVDADYRGELLIQVYNAASKTTIIPGGYEMQWLPNEVKAGERIAQMELVPDLSSNVEIEVVNELSNTARGSGGFGSTGK